MEEKKGAVVFVTMQKAKSKKRLLAGMVYRKAGMFSPLERERERVIEEKKKERMNDK